MKNIWEKFMCCRGWHKMTKENKDLQHYCERCGDAWETDLVGGFPPTPIRCSISMEKIGRSIQGKEGMVLVVWGEKVL